MQKNQFLSKLNRPDYNNMLEEVLESKPYKEDAKSLLLSMLYKIETSYDDYSIVKRNAIEKSDFLEQIIKTIKYNCDDILLVEPNSEIGLSMNGKIAQVKKNKIIAFPTEYALLTAISEIIQVDFLTDSSIFSEEMQKILKNGYKEEITETIYSFDGWNWNIKKSSLYSLLYQNMLILLGIDFVNRWRNGNKSIKRVKDKLLDLYGGENKTILLEETERLIAKGFIIDFPDKAKEYLQKLKRLTEEYKKLNNTASYINEISDLKTKIKIRMREIDSLLLDKNLLKKKYEDENSTRTIENKIFSIRRYAEILNEEKTELVKKLNQYNKLIDPIKLIEKKEALKYEIGRYAVIEKEFKNERNFKQVVIDFQRIFLKILEVKVEKLTTKKELINLIYILRYYKYIKLESYIKEMNEIKKEVGFVERQLLLKSINSDVFCNISNNQLHTIDILQKILDTNIIDLEDIYVFPKISKNCITLDIYDGEILEKTIELSPEIKEIELKNNKKTKLFN